MSAIASGETACASTSGGRYGRRAAELASRAGQDRHPLAHSCHAVGEGHFVE
jgi:hypothetical protein